MANIEYKEVYDQIKDFDEDQLKDCIVNEYRVYISNYYKAHKALVSRPLDMEYCINDPKTVEKIIILINRTIEYKHKQLKKFIEDNPDKTKYLLYLIDVVAPIVLLEDRDLTTKLIVACIIAIYRMGIDDILKKLK